MMIDGMIDEHETMIDEHDTMIVMILNSALYLHT